MARAFAILHPRPLTGMSLLALSFWPALEGVILHSLPEVFIASVLAAIGLVLCRRKVAAQGELVVNSLLDWLKHWAKFSAVAVPVLLIAYLASYLVLMDRNLPTSHFRYDAGYFESSFRWSPKQHIGKGEGPREGCPEVTILNIIYRPLDHLFFKFYPRSDAEVERLRGLRYYR